MLQGKQIFYIEDDVKNRIIVQTILEAAGAKVAVDNWGFVEVLIPRLKTIRPDLILLDLMFTGGISGYDVFDALRKTFPYTPVVAVSASDPAVEIPRARAKGFAGFISKPINLRLFPDQLCRVLNGETVWYTG